MIEFLNSIQEEPYLLFKEKYEMAHSSGQLNIEAISISSFNKAINEIDSRYVNLKFINGDRFIFFSNYNSPKSEAFNSFNKISALIFWPSINVQIRMKSVIGRTSDAFNKQYFKNRSPKKNALSISSTQSNKILSYDEIVENYNETYKNNDLSICPEYWGGFSFIPYYFEFWEGHELRINKRLVYEKINNNWEKYIIQP